MSGQVLVSLLAAVAILAVWALASYHWPVSRIVYEHERGLRYRKGKLTGEAGPGRYWLQRRIDEIRTLDIRRQLLIVSGQEVLTSDRVPLKISLMAEFTVADVKKALTEVEDFRETIHAELQLALRRVVAERDMDAALAERGEIGDALRDLCSGRLAELGVELHSVGVRDYMMGAGLRNSYAAVVEARQEGLAALERARGEGAAVRSLANSAQLFERHPGLMQLRLLQALEAGQGNRVVVSLGDQQRGLDLAQGAATEDA